VLHKAVDMVADWDLDMAADRRVVVEALHMEVAGSPEVLEEGHCVREDWSALL